MALRAIMVDRARTVGKAAQPTRVDGRTIYAEVRSDWMRVRLELPVAGAAEGQPLQQPRRAVKTPTLYCMPDADGGCPFQPEFVVEVRSDQLGDATYKVAGTPGPWRKKRRVIGYQVPLQRVDERPTGAPRTAA